MAFAGKNRYEETKEEKISKELNEDINNFLKSFASMVGTSAIKENINRMAGSKKANIEEYSKKLEGMLKDAVYGKQLFSQRTFFPATGTLQASNGCALCAGIVL